MKGINILKATQTQCITIESRSATPCNAHIYYIYCKTTSNHKVCTTFHLLSYFSGVDQIEFHWIIVNLSPPPQIKKTTFNYWYHNNLSFFCFFAERLNGAFTVSINVNETSLTTVARDQHVVHVIEVKGLRDRRQCSLIVVANMTRSPMHDLLDVFLGDVFSSKSELVPKCV